MHWRTIIFGLLPGALLASAAGAADPPDARKLYATKCAGCHKLYDPAGYTTADWNQWMQKMRRKARLSDQQIALLNTLVVTNAPAAQNQP